MLFNSLEFLLGFLPVALLVFYLLPIRARVPFLLIASLFFYGMSGIYPLIAMVLSILWGFATALFVQRHPSRKALILAISFPLLVLWFFKYLDFTLDSLRAGEQARDFFYFFLSVTLPSGISFYTFQIVSYSIDVTDRRAEPERDWIKLATYISFFPQLIAGPILRYDQIREQLTRVATERDLRPNLREGIKYFSYGFFAKVFFADILATLNSAFDLGSNASSLDAAFSILAYSFRIYYDFWSYSLMAIGLGKLFGINLPRNFVEPYLSENPREFWRRWHVTLSYWLRDYVYIKLGGNRAYVRNIAIVFLTCGLWHGAGWSFVVWGGYHAILVIGYHLARRPWDRLPRLLRIGLTFALVTLGWPLFYSDVEQYLELMRQLFALPLVAQGFGATHWLYLGCVASVTFLVREDAWLYTRRRLAVVDWAVVHATLVSVALLFLRFSQTFIYFRF